jgi:hypothetical protein
MGARLFTSLVNIRCRSQLVSATREMTKVVIIREYSGSTLCSTVPMSEALTDASKKQLIFDWINAPGWPLVFSIAPFLPDPKVSAILQWLHFFQFS